MIDKLLKLRENLTKVILGKPAAADLVITALCANANILMEDVPGIGKTTMAKALAASIQADFKRVQFTPDLLPSDILGSSIFNPQTGEFTFRQGPVFTNILLADEINRASPRTQSALLEAMSERQVSLDGRTYPLPHPFLVIATENPIEYQGTYPLPEAQLDRFAMQIALGYPDEEHEIEIVHTHRDNHPLQTIGPVLTLTDIQSLQQQVREVQIERSMAEYLARVVRATREEPSILLGASPRALITLMRCAQARAYLDGRNFIIPEDVKSLAVVTLAHRIVLENKSRYSGVDRKTVIRDVIDKVKVPA